MYRLAVVALLAVAASFPVVAPQASEPLCEGLPNRAGVTLCVTNVDGEEPAWTLRTASGRARQIKTPKASLSHVAELRVSPSGRYAAVVSVGEGHPILDLFDLHAVLDDDAPEPLATVNPYPGMVSIREWTGDLLVVESDMPLDHPGSDAMPDELRTFLVAAPSGAVTGK
jgi:hypothetical protein